MDWNAASHDGATVADDGLSVNTTQSWSTPSSSPDHPLVVTLLTDSSRIPLPITIAVPFDDSTKIRNMERFIQIQDQQLAQKKRLITEKDRTIAEKDRTIAEQDKIIKDLTDLLYDNGIIPSSATTASVPRSSSPPEFPPASSEASNKSAPSQESQSTAFHSFYSSCKMAIQVVMPSLVTMWVFAEKMSEFNGMPSAEDVMKRLIFSRYDKSQSQDDVARDLYFHFVGNKNMSLNSSTLVSVGAASAIPNTSSSDTSHGQDCTCSNEPTNPTGATAGRSSSSASHSNESQDSANSESLTTNSKRYFVYRDRFVRAKKFWEDRK